ncbi:hypothetical protein MTO96_023842 [Rhipicephalus appendiculatus]
MAEGASASGGRRTRVSGGQREIILAFMEQHPQLVSRAVELGPHFTLADRRRLWQQLEDALNAEGPARKETDGWQEWWRKQVHDARHDAAAVAEVQRSTGGGRAPVFRGRVLQLTGTLRLSGVTDLPFQEKHRIHRVVREGWLLHLTLHRIERSTTPACCRGGEDGSSPGGNPAGAPPSGMGPAG